MLTLRWPSGTLLLGAARFICVSVFCWAGGSRVVLLGFPAFVVVLGTGVAFRFFWGGRPLLFFVESIRYFAKRRFCGRCCYLAWWGAGGKREPVVIASISSCLESTDKKNLVEISLHGVDLTNQRGIRQCMRSVEVEKDGWSESPTLLLLQTFGTKKQNIVNRERCHAVGRRRETRFSGDL